MGTHRYIEDPRNQTILININGELFPRSEAKISVFDSGFILGDGVWEGIRLHQGHLALELSAGDDFDRRHTVPHATHRHIYRCRSLLLSAFARSLFIGIGKTQLGN